MSRLRVVHDAVLTFILGVSIWELIIHPLIVMFHKGYIRWPL